MSTRRTLSWLYWLFTGAVIGFGVISILSIGILFLVLGFGLLVFGLIRGWFGGLWAALVGFGGLPALILVWDVTSAPWACISNVAVLSIPHVNYYTCVDTFFGRVTTYHVLAIGFGIIALLGLAWPLLSRRGRRPRRLVAQP